MSKLKYITLTQLMASVSDDFRKYADSGGLIDPIRYIKVIRACNEKLGLRIYDSRQAILPLDKGIAQLPNDFYKVEMAFGINTSYVNTMLPVGPGATQVTTKPDPNTQQLVNYTSACLDQAGNCYWQIKTPATQLQFKVTEFVPLSLSNGSYHHSTEYCTNRHWGIQKNAFEIDVEDNIIKTHLNGGCLYISYLADMKNEEGEDLIPFHPLLNNYYEWAVKTKILEDIYFNSDDDVERKYAKAERERNFSFQDAVNFAMGKEAKEWQRYEKERSHKFFQKYYQIFF